MNSSDSSVCNFCENPFDDNTRTKRYCCSKDHFICTACIKPFFVSGVFACPFGLKEMSLRQKTLDAFPLVQSKIIANNEDSDIGCSVHGIKAIVNSICLECRKKLCFGCESKHKAQRHKIVYMKDIEKEKEEMTKLINLKFTEAEKIQEEKDKIIDETKNRLKMELDQQIELCINKLENQKEKFYNMINICLAELKNYNSSSNFEGGIASWKSSTQQKLEDIVQSKTDDAIIFALSNEMDLMDKSMEKYTDDINKDVNRLKSQMSRLTFEFSSRVIDSFEKILSEELQSFKQKAKSQKVVLKDEFKDKIDPVPVVQKQKSVSFQIEERKDEYSEIRQPAKENQFIDKAAFMRIIFEANQIPIEVGVDSGITLTTAEGNILNNESVANLKKVFLDDLPIEYRDSISKIDLSFSGLNAQALEKLGDFLYFIIELTHIALRFENFDSDVQHTTFVHLEKAYPGYDKLVSLELDIIKWDRMSNGCLNCRALNLNRLKKLKDLKLNFSECWKIGNNGIRDFFSALEKIPSLEKVNLNFSSCPSITDRCFNDIKMYANSAVNLKELDLNFQE